MDGNTAKADGHMFTVKARGKTITISSMDIRASAESGTSIIVIVFTKKGDYEGDQLNASAWTKLCMVSVNSKGEKELTSIPESCFDNLEIGKKSRQSFYIRVKESMLMSSQGPKWPKSFKNDDLKVLSNSSAIKGYFKKEFKNYLWNGQILYKVDDK